MCTNLVIENQFRLLDEFIDSLDEKQANLIAVLHKAQEIFGYLPDNILYHVAQKLDLPSAKVYGVVTFYSYFTTKPRGKHVINVCMGTACYVRGADKILNQVENILGIKTGETTTDGEFTLDSLRCVGACGLAPVMIVDGKVHGRLSISDVAPILKECSSREEDNRDKLKVS